MNSHGPHAGPDDESLRPLYGTGYASVGLPMMAVAAVTALIAWRNGGSGPILAISTALTAVIAGLAALVQRRGLAPSVPTLIGILVVGDVAVGAWGVAYRGLDGGLWVSVLILSFVAGMTLGRTGAAAIGGFGAVTVIGIAVIWDQIDGVHLATLTLGASASLVTALLASAYHEATVKLIRGKSEAHLAALEDANLHLTAVIQGMSEGLVTTDESGKVERWNKALERLTGRSEIEVVSMPVEDALVLLSPTGRMAGADHPCRRARNGPVLEGSPAGDARREITLVAADDRLVPVTVSAAPLLSGKELVGTAAVVVDLSRERELSDARDALVSMVSHELRTPLTMILGFSELLAEGGMSPDEQARCARQIDESAQRLSSLIEDLLSAAAVESGRVELNRRSVPVSDLVSDSISTVSPESRGRIRARVPGELVVHGDPDKLLQVMANLLGNALKYSDDCDQVTVKAGRDDGGVWITVSDSGIGIADDERADLFEKFTRTEGARSAGVQGTGLGLYIARQLVEIHGGSIAVRSSQGVGSDFTFVIPDA